MTMEIMIYYNILYYIILYNIIYIINEIIGINKKIINYAIESCFAFKKFTLYYKDSNNNSRKNNQIIYYISR